VRFWRCSKPKFSTWRWFIFEHPDIPDRVNLQSVKGQAKPYQIRQFLIVIEQYNLTLKDQED